jgi:hypothetical protein
VDHFGFLRDNLLFLRWFYEQSTKSFSEIKRRIEAYEEPYVPRADYDDAEPPFLSEWLEANDAIKLQGQVCLSLLQRSFREYLDSTVKLHPQSQPERKGNWFDNYKRWFLHEAGIDWERSPVAPVRIEELTIARNCVEHGSGSIYDAGRLVKHQSENYHERFPDAVFASDFETALWREMNYPQPVAIELTLDKLGKAIDDLLAFSNFVEKNLPPWMAR